MARRSAPRAASSNRRLPAWQASDDPALGGPFVDRVSWFPPGRRYEWTGSVTRTHRRAVDPWAIVTPGRIWSGVVALVTGTARTGRVRGR